jgi:glycosyltransferase involved in cell wall biosynthesis
MNDKEKIRVLILHSNPTPPRPEPEKNFEYHLSAACAGDLVSPHWGKRSGLPDKPISEIYNTLGSFEYHPTFESRLPGLLKVFKNLFFYIRQGLSLSRQKGRYDLIVAYGPYTCLMAALVIRFFTRSKVVVMLPAPPIESFKLVPGRLAKIKHTIASWIVPAMIRASDAVWAYYPTQLDPLPLGKYPRMFVFPEFVPISTIAAAANPAENPRARYIYFLGHPFDRKGVDLLLKAFQEIAAKHPDVSLNIVGHCPDLTPYQKLANNSSRVTFRPGVFHKEAMELMENCTVFCLPSRLEGVPRVIMEAMACKRPVVASRIHGIPTLIEHGKTGLLFESEDVDGLAAQLDRVLSDRDFARQLGSSAHRFIIDRFSEKRYVEFFRNMAAAVTSRVGHQSPQACSSSFAELKV